MSEFVQLQPITENFLSKILNNLKSGILDELSFTKESINVDLKKLKNVLDTLNKFKESENMVFTLKGNWESIVFTSLLKHLDEKNRDELTELERKKLSPFFREDLKKYKSELNEDNNVELTRLLSINQLEIIEEDDKSEYLRAIELFNINLNAKRIMLKIEGGDDDRMFEYRKNLLVNNDFVIFLGDDTKKIQKVLKYILKKLVKNDEIKLERKKIEDEKIRKDEEIRKRRRSLGLI